MLYKCDYTLSPSQSQLLYSLFIDIHEDKASRWKVTSSQKDMNSTMSELTGHASVFDEVPGRKYKHICVLKKVFVPQS